jgi:hypothetical protein
VPDDAPRERRWRVREKANTLVGPYPRLGNSWSSSGLKTRRLTGKLDTLARWTADSFQSGRAGPSRALWSRSPSGSGLGELGEGDRLPSERGLAAAMQISRPTLREAVRVLVDPGVLGVRTGSAGTSARWLRSARPTTRASKARWTST